jgi:hypothetical protein
VDVSFEDVEATQKNSAETLKQAEQLALDEALARQKQQDKINGNSSTTTTTSTATAATTTSSSTYGTAHPVAPTVVPAAHLSPRSPVSPQNTLQQNMAKLKMENSDFFADM